MSNARKTFHVGLPDGQVHMEIGSGAAACRPANAPTEGAARQAVPAAPAAIRKSRRRIETGHRNLQGTLGA